MKKLLYFALSALLLTGCAQKNNSGKEARESYKVSLEDSIKNITSEIDSCNDMALSLSDKVRNLLPEFRAVENAREVEGYMIFQGWQNRYPLQSSGVVARLNASRQLELVAAFTAPFDQIRVNVPSETAMSAVVPHDQALNYRREGLTTVLFGGEEADSIAKLIADNELNPITVSFLNGGKTVGSWKMANGNAKMITMSYLLYSSHREQLRLEQRSMMLGEKLKLLRRHLESEKSRSESGEKDDR